MNNLVIREAFASDMADIMRLIGQTDMSPDNVLTDSEVESVFEKISKISNHRLFVGEFENKIIATFALILVQQLSHNAARSMNIEDIVVNSQFQGRGFGKQVMSFASEDAKSNGCYKLILSSGNARKKAHSFYEDLGYRQDGIRFALNL